ncbi:Peptide-N4-(N-acetyl-beta-glucosaminyl)asparagine amidase A [Hibiscus syriacus]|uniref:Peptide-N4-(N-acetyl-beta-glucosaminyl)asparagine amidase A n=1 Tax=Hibiscus syriacus TaxID=106335 RepID=A0A6A2YHM8_HIBSY|nr:peptide-N4-(N-acetyl-beta-glucosaminyl)asparagine amidase A-like [Hibiscus syriacus]KAE8677309.1 Peptide-N4-(N-acetyl-beta-glucosaminyl)asparagine amidase A [Hibiscus syriacus]
MPAKPSMASFTLNPLLYLLPLLFLDPFFSQANLHNSKTLLRSSLFSQPPSTNETIPPTLFFEVTKPIQVPHSKPCSLTLLQHDFGFTYGKSPVLADYNFPSDCPFQEFSKIVLEWNATCKGRQFDRIFGVWLSGVELLRSCTAEPRATGIFWTVQKDITRYSSLLLSNKTQTFTVYLGNLVDRTYTGVYHVNVTLYFYPAVEKMDLFKEKRRNLGSGIDSEADLIIPFSRDLPLNDGLWYEIQNAGDVKVKEFEIPQNVNRAVLEVYVSFHENDEFWYGNLPNEYIAANNLTGYAGNGPFREVVVGLDGDVVGAIWPFTVVFTGGINPLLWRPISAIGSFDLPSYDIEITPFLGNLLDGKLHNLSFSVTNALNVWYIDANLHLWLDSKSSKTEGKVLQYEIVPLGVSSVLDFKGLNGTFVTNTTRFISSTGWVTSSYGKVTTKATQDLSYGNTMVVNESLQIINQITHFNDSVNVNNPAPNAISKKSLKRFLFYMYSDEIDQGNGTSLSVANVRLGFNEKKFNDAGAGSPSSSLQNLQNGKGVMVVKDNLVVRGVASTQQSYNYRGGRFCYSRNVSSSNYTILYDEVRDTCNKKSKSGFGFGLSRWWPVPARRAFLSSHVVDPNGNE